MPTKPLSDELARQAGEAYLQHGATRAAQLLGLPRPTLDRRVQVAIERGFIQRRARGSAPAASAPAPTDGEREAFLRQNQRGVGGVELPPEAMDDLRYFGEQAKRGRAIRTAALLEWLRTKHAIEVGMTRLHRIATAAGVTPWWSPR